VHDLVEVVEADDPGVLARDATGAVELVASTW
jgi:hypothetical protein